MIKIFGQMLVARSQTKNHFSMIELDMILVRNELTCIRIIAMVSPAGARRLNRFGNAVAKITTTAVMAGRLPPLVPKYFVRKIPALQMAKDTASAAAVSRTGGLLSGSGSGSGSFIPLSATLSSSLYAKITVMQLHLSGKAVFDVLELCNRRHKINIFVKNRDKQEK